MGLNFESGVTKLSRKIYINLELDSGANKFISKNLHMLFRAIVNNMKDSTTEPKVEDIQKATAKLLPSNLKKYAICEAQKEVFMAHTFSTEFLPNRLITQHVSELKAIEDEKKENRELMQSNFFSGIRLILKDTFPGLKLDKTGSQEIATYLIYLSEVMTQQLKQHKSQKATAEDLQQVVQDLFPKSLAEHAKSEAHRMLFDYENKRFTYLPEKYKKILSNKPSLDSSRKEIQEEREKGKINEEQIKDLKNGIMSIVEQIHDNISINPMAMNIFCRETSNFWSSLIDHLRQGDTPKTPEQVEEIVSVLLPPLMAEHAIAEGQKLVRRFEAEEFDLDLGTVSKSEEETKEVKSKKELTKDIPNIRKVFETGITSIAKVTQPKTNLHKTAVSIIGEELDDLCTIIIKTIHDTSTHNIDISDIQEAAKNLMPEDLFEHAIAEGEKMIKLYEMKAIKFTPKKKKPRELSMFE